MLQRCVFAFITILLFNTGWTVDVLAPTCGIPQTLDLFLNHFAEEQLQKGLTLIAKNIDTADNCCEEEYGKIKKLSLIFEVNATLDVPNARALVLGVVDDLLKQLNAQKKLSELFVSCTVTADDLDVRIRPHTEECGFIYPVMGNISFVDASDGFVTYGTINSYTYLNDVLRRETYQQARKLNH